MVKIRIAFICHKAACVPGSQPRPGSIIARSTAHRPETRRNRAHFAARTRRNFLSFGNDSAVQALVVAHQTGGDVANRDNPLTLTLSEANEPRVRRHATLID